MSSPTEDFAALQAAEYGTYIAVHPILHFGARAYNVGNPVPKANVEQYGYLAQGLVSEVGAAPPAAPEASQPPPLPMGEPVVINPAEPEKG